MSNLFFCKLCFIWGEMNPFQCNCEHITQKCSFFPLTLPIKISLTVLSLRTWEFMSPISLSMSSDGVLLQSCVQNNAVLYLLLHYTYWQMCDLIGIRVLRIYHRKYHKILYWRIYLEYLWKITYKWIIVNVFLVKT